MHMPFQLFNQYFFADITSCNVLNHATPDVTNNAYPTHMKQQIALIHSFSCATHNLLTSITVAFESTSIDEETL